ncbi:hypothetical protein M513_12739 [Trichuris suis]|uniref:Uncharacterized protein n=1 Tax=Trichuris suis TaxID=68888 RepID=A0A085LN22_9BILA|nr:hypothetical protein M513_12739 [Trichuris suis]
MTWGVLYSNYTIFFFGSDEMIADIDVLRPSVELWITSQTDCPLVVTEHTSSVRLLPSEIQK